MQMMQDKETQSGFGRLNMAAADQTTELPGALSTSHEMPHTIDKLSVSEEPSLCKPGDLHQASITSPAKTGGAEHPIEELTRQLLIATEQNVELQVRLRDLESILETTRTDPSCKADSLKLEAGLEELRADIARREEAITHMRAVMSVEGATLQASLDPPTMNGSSVEEINEVVQASSTWGATSAKDTEAQGPMEAAHSMPLLESALCNQDEQRQASDVLLMQPLLVKREEMRQESDKQARGLTESMDSILKKHWQAMHLELQELCSEFLNFHVLPRTSLPEHQLLPEAPKSKPPPALSTNASVSELRSATNSFKDNYKQDGCMPKMRHAYGDNALRDQLFTKESTKSPTLQFALEINNVRMSQLKESIKVSKARELAGKTKHFLLGLKPHPKALGKHKEIVFESAMALVIFVNAILIGIRMDVDSKESMGWIISDAGFSILYCFELGLKVAAHGFQGHFCGKDRFSNIFDASVVFIDLAQLILELFPRMRDAISDAPSAALFRVMRLAKLTRTLRLLRSAVFKDLVSMMHGMAGGLQTLGWAMILFIGVVYVVSLIFRESLGREENDDIDHVYEMFHNVPRAMYTTFRCSFGDCSSPDGVPVFEYVAMHYSWVYSLIYCFFLFVITMGLFNVISAIFLEATMAAASALADEKKRMRLHDKNRWNSRTVVLVSQLVRIAIQCLDDGLLREADVCRSTMSIDSLLEMSCDAMASVSVPWIVINKWSEDAKVQTTLNDLDIDPHDAASLPDFLDPDNNGRISIIELLDGLARLRGSPKRSDILTVDLMVRSVQKNVNKILQVIDCSP